MRCDCSVDPDTFDIGRCYSETWRVARKPWTCCECGETIEPDQRYHCATAVWHGKWDAFQTCEPCARIRRDYCPGGFVFGELAETIYDCLGFDYREIPEDEEVPCP